MQGRPLDDLPPQLRPDREWCELHVKENRCWWCKEDLRAERAAIYVGIKGKTYECLLHPSCCAFAALWATSHDPG